MLTKTWMQWASKWKWCARNVIAPHPTPTLPASMCADDRSMCEDDPLQCAQMTRLPAHGIWLKMLKTHGSNILGGDHRGTRVLETSSESVWPSPQRRKWWDWDLANYPKEMFRLLNLKLKPSRPVKARNGFGSYLRNFVIAEVTFEILRYLPYFLRSDFAVWGEDRLIMEERMVKVDPSM